MNRREIINAIKAVYRDALCGNLVGVILTGSAGNALADTHSDIDYVIIVKEIAFETPERMSFAKEKLSAELSGVPLSPSIVRWEEIENINMRNFAVDHKIVQAMIQCTNQDCWLEDGCKLPGIEPDVVKAFSKDAYFQVKHLLLKTLIRSDTEMGEETKIKIIKLNRILLKLYGQYKDIFEQLKADSDEFDAVKRTIHQTTSAEIREITVRNLGNHSL